MREALSQKKKNFIDEYLVFSNISFVEHEPYIGTKIIFEKYFKLD